MARKAGSVGSETAERILQASLQLISRYGYAAVSMRQIASEVGLQAGALYNHFPTKQAILHQLMIAHLEELIETLETADLPGDPARALEAFVRFHIHFHIDKPEAVFIAYMELRNLEAGPYREVMQLRQRYERALRDILRSGMAAGVFDVPDAPVASMAIISMLTGVNTWYRYGGRLSVAEIEKIYINMVLAAVGARVKAPSQQKLEELA